MTNIDPLDPPMQSDLGSEQYFMVNARFTLLVHNEAMNAFTVCADKESNMGKWSRDHTILNRSC